MTAPPLMLAAVCAGAAAWLGLAAPVVVGEVGRRRGPRALLGALPVVVAAVVAIGVLAARAPTAIPSAVVLGSAALFLAHAARHRRARQQAVIAADRVLAVCEQVGSDVAAGQSPESAFRAAAESWPEVAEVVRSGDLGGDPVRALRVAGALPGREGFVAVAAGLALAEDVGAPIGPVLDRVAERLRAARETARLVEGELASARATARLVAVLPFAVLLLGRGTGGDPLGFLLASPAGVGCLAGGLLLAVVGVAWIDRLADAAAHGGGAR